MLGAIRTLPMSQRRWMFVALLGREFKTFDNVMAFARSVNVVVNLNDLPHLPAILKKGITDHVEFYRTFRQVLVGGRQALISACGRSRLRRPPAPRRPWRSTFGRDRRPCGAG